MKLIYHAGFGVSPVDTARMKRHLREQEHEVLEAISVTAAIDFLNRGPQYCDAVVAHGDGFSDMSGIATLVAVKADLRLKAAPVIVVERRFLEADILSKHGIFADDAGIPNSVNDALGQVAAWQVAQ